MTVHMIGRYDPCAGTVVTDGVDRNFLVNDEPGLVLLHEAAGILHVDPLRTGDMIVLPSGTFHTFAAAPGISASYGALEVCDDSTKMYQAHFDSEARDPRRIIANTIMAAGQEPPNNLELLSLADVPGFSLYVEERKADGV